MTLPSELSARYEHVRDIGAGGQGRTTLVRDRRSAREYVLKELDLHGASSLRAIDLFRQEARTLEQLEHPGIPSYIDEYEIEDRGEQRYFLVQEYVAGDTLEAFIDSGKPMPRIRLLELLGELTAVLGYLHRQDPPVLHRDIKPANIILREGGGVALVDFGAAQHVRRESTSNTTVVGTTGYMAPEQFTGRAVPASDVYGLGATFVHLATRKHPVDLLDSSLQLDFDDYLADDPDLRALLRLMTQVEVENRIPSATDLQTILNDLASIHDYRPPRTATMLTRVAPRGSRVTVHRTPVGLEITVPPVGRRVLVAEVLVFLFCFALLVPIAFLPSRLEVFQQFLNFGFYAVGALFVAAVVQIRTELRRLVRTELVIDEHQIQITTSRLTTRRQTLPRDIIVSVSAQGMIVGGTTNRPTAIRLRSRSGDVVEFGHLLSSREREWIIDELESVLATPVPAKLDA